jgi:hypothetical protein
MEHRKIVEICKFDIPNTHINDPSWLSSDTSIKSEVMEKNPAELQLLKTNMVVIVFRN